MQAIHNSLTYFCHLGVVCLLQHTALEWVIRTAELTLCVSSASLAFALSGDYRSFFSLHSYQFLIVLDEKCLPLLLIICLKYVFKCNMQGMNVQLSGMMFV